MQVMIATDGTDTAIAAARHAVGLLHPDARIALVTVIAARPEPMEDAGGFAGPLISEDQADDEWHDATAAGREALVRTLDALESADVNIDEARMVPSQDSADRALAALVAEERPDLLVLGSNERGWFDRMLHGATDTRLLHEAPCPLLIVAHQQD